MKKLLIILAALAMIFSSGCWSCRKNNNNCKRSIAPEANTLISNAQSGNFLYPAGFYIDTTPPVSTCYYYSFVCASTTVQADAIFDYSNTVNAWGYTSYSERATSMYYERDWNANPVFQQRVYNCSYYDPSTRVLQSVTSTAAVKEFAEYWLLNENCSGYGPVSYPGEVKDIYSSDVTQTAGAYTSDIKYYYYQPSVDWGICSAVIMNEAICTVSTTDGTVTWQCNSVNSYETGN